MGAGMGWLGLAFGNCGAGRMECLWCDMFADCLALGVLYVLLDLAAGFPHVCVLMIDSKSQISMLR